MQPWKTLESIATPEGKLELRQRGARAFLITIGGRVLMSSEAHRSETELAQLACDALAGRARPRVLLGGLGLGYTLRAALDRLPPRAEVTVVDLNAAVIAWCRGPLATLTDDALGDKRVTCVVGDVARVIAAARPGTYDAIIVDLYEGPHQVNNRAYDPLYGHAALARTAAALTPDGIAAIWSEERDEAFEARFNVDFVASSHKAPRGGRKHVVYLGKRALTRGSGGPVWKGRGFGP